MLRLSYVEAVAETWGLCKSMVPSPVIHFLTPSASASRFAFQAQNDGHVRGESRIENSNIIYRGSIDRSFRILKIEWSIYDIQHPKVRGTVRLVGIPTNIYEVPRNLLPAGTLGPVFNLATQGIVGFANQGKKGASDPREITHDEYRKLPKEDITSYTHARDEPLNEFLVTGNPAFLVRTKTVLIKAELVKDRYDAFGDPQVIVAHNTTHSVTKYKADESSSP